MWYLDVGSPHLCALNITSAGTTLQEVFHTRQASSHPCFLLAAYHINESTHLYDLNISVDCSAAAPPHITVVASKVLLGTLSTEMMPPASEGSVAGGSSTWHMAASQTENTMYLGCVFKPYVIFGS
jgi:hypothetical protein